MGSVVVKDDRCGGWHDNIFCLVDSMVVYDDIMLSIVSWWAEQQSGMTRCWRAAVCIVQDDCC